MPQSKLEPKLITVLKEGYSLTQLRQDVIAGLIVGIVALPLAIAFAIASGVKPEQGLYTAVIAGFIISVLGGSRVQIGGPTGAFIVIVYEIVHQYGYEGLATATLMAGVLLVIMGFARLGAVIQFIPYPLTIGFTSGIALIISVTQARDFFGLQMATVPGDFMEKCVAYYEHSSTWNPEASGIGLFTVAIVWFWPRITRRVPGSLIAIFGTTAIVHGLGLSVETIGSRFGAVPSSLPMPHLPNLEWDHVKQLFSPALSIALLGGIESLLSAVVADGMTGRRHRSNMEIIAQGVANIASPIFGGIPATGAIARTATNIKSGGRTPIAGIVHAFTLLCIMVFVGKWAALIPLATLAGILLVVAYNMSEWRLFVKLLRSPKSDVAIMLNSFLLTVLVDLTIAIQVGVVLSAFLFMRRMSEVTQIGYTTMATEEEDDPTDPNAIGQRTIPDGVAVFEVYGSFFFGAAEKFKTAITQIEKQPRVLILRLRHVLAIDATALRAVEDLYERIRNGGGVLLLSGIHAQPLVALERAGLFDLIGKDNVTANIDLAIKRAEEILATVDQV
ncbi:MAG: SulP family sulfate permease [Candidatus Latescibacterota bacterium]|jgi:SulP family sulfate permease